MCRIRFSLSDIFWIIICSFIASWYFIPAVKITIQPIIIVLLGLFILCSMILNHTININNVVVFAAALLIIGLLYYLYTYSFDFNKASGIITQLFVSSLPAIIYCFVRNRKSIFQPVLIIISLMVLYIFVKTFVYLTINPNVARWLAYGGASGNITDNDLQFYRIQNIGGFGHSYGTAFLSGLFYYLWISKETNRRCIFFALFILSLIYVYMTKYFLALIVIIMLVVLCSMRTVKMKYRVIAILLGIVLLFFSSTILRSLSQITTGNISSKFLEISDSITYMSFTGSSLTARVYVYELSLKNFILSPIIGHRAASQAYVTSGGHSTILDFMALGGIIGLSVYSAVLRFVKNTILLHKTVYITIFAMYIVLGIFNPTMNMYELSGFVFLFIPLVILRFSVNGATNSKIASDENT